MRARSQAPLLGMLSVSGALRIGRVRATPSHVCRQCRAIQISASPATEFSKVSGDAFGAPADGSRDSADARFEVLGSPYSLLSVTLSASQKLYTRRGTLVSVAGKVENTQSTLSILSPLRRALFGVPFLYQRISSTSPITALIATKSPSTTFFTLRLDGTTDWIVAQRNALLAWTGHTLAVSPRIQRKLSLAHWGSSHLTGRGLAALSAPGYIYPVTLGDGEELVVHPSHVVAYAENKNPPQPFRFKSSNLRLQVPSVPAYVSRVSSDMIPEGMVRFWTAMRDTDTYKFLARLFFGLRTAARRSIWGDRLFLQFRGPTTLLLSSRGVRVSESLTRDDVNEIADTEAGVVPAAIELAAKPRPTEEELAAQSSLKASSVGENAAAIHIASVRPGGKVEFEEAKNLKEFVR